MVWGYPYFRKPPHVLGCLYRMGPTFTIMRSVAFFQWLNSMVYGRYNELVSMGFMNQQTSLGGTILLLGCFSKPKF